MKTSTQQSKIRAIKKCKAEIKDSREQLKDGLISLVEYKWQAKLTKEKFQREMKCTQE